MIYILDLILFHKKNDRTKITKIMFYLFNLTNNTTSTASAHMSKKPILGLLDDQNYVNCWLLIFFYDFTFLNILFHCLLCNYLKKSLRFKPI